MKLLPRLIVVAGPNGSGKTQVCWQLLRHPWGEGCDFINPDQIAQEKYGDWNDSQRLREAYLAEGRSLMLETVFSAPDKIVFIEKPRKAAFFIRLFFICTSDPRINLRRIERRVDLGGHRVPEEKVRSRYRRSIRNCLQALPLVQRVYLIDNSVDEADPVFLFRAENGRLKKRYVSDLPAWSLPILAGAASAE